MWAYTLVANTTAVISLIFLANSCYAMRTCLLVFLLARLNLSFSQDTSWHKFRLDSNLILELNGTIEKEPQATVGRYSFEGYSVKTDNAVYVVMVGRSKEEIKIFDRADYQRVLDQMAEGEVEAARERNWKILLEDTLIDRVPGKKMTYTGKYFGRDLKGYNYFFIVNGLGYSINALFLGSTLSHKDSTDIRHILSSIDFPDKIQGLQFANKKEYIAYHAGKLTVLFLLSVAIILIVIFFVRRL